MCLAVPAKVIGLLPEKMARISLDGVTKEVSVALIDEISVGDYVIIHVGYALTRLDRDEAIRTLELIAEMTGRRPVPAE